MITEDYVSFKVAKLLKEKGFDGRENHVHQGYFNENLIDYTLFGFCDGEILLAPTHQMALKWLREVHKIFISIVCCTYRKLNKVIWVPDITTFESVFPNSAIECDTYEDAVEAALKYTLENLI